MSQDKTWVDPIVGLTQRSPGQHRVRLARRARRLGLAPEIVLAR